MTRISVLPFLLALCSASCTMTVLSRSEMFEDRTIRFDDRGHNPVIVIPGILGSALKDRESGRVVWGAFRGDYANPNRPDGARLVALPMQRGVPLHDLRDEVVPDGVLDRLRVSILGLPVELHAYLYVMHTLGVGGFRDETLGRTGDVIYPERHFTCFQFDYDWRRDNAENARRLHEFILEKKRYVLDELEKRYGDRRTDIKFDVVAHSMGALLLRYYLLYGPQPLPDDGSLPVLDWAGAEHVDRAILVGPPNAGSLQTLLDLTRGASLAFLLPTYPPEVIGTLPAPYQLLPRTRHRSVVDAADPDGTPIDLFDPEVWVQHGWGLAAPGADEKLQVLLPETRAAEERRAVALDHLRKILRRAEQFQRAIDVPARRPETLDVHLFAGDAEPTISVLGVDRATGKLLNLRRAPGDGVVLRSSTVLDERRGGPPQPRILSPIDWSSITFVFSDHLGMTRDPAFTDNVLFRLLEAPRRVTATELGATAPSE